MKRHHPGQADVATLPIRGGKAGLAKGTTIGIDATTLEVNAALRSIIRRDTGESYEFLMKLAKASGGSIGGARRRAQTCGTPQRRSSR